MLICRLGNSYFIMLSVCVPMLNLLMFFHKNEDSFLFITCIFTISGDTYKISVLRSTNMSNYINEQYSTKGCLHPIWMLLIMFWIFMLKFFSHQCSQVRMILISFFVQLLSGFAICFKNSLEVFFYSCFVLFCCYGLKQFTK